MLYANKLGGIKVNFYLDLKHLFGNEVSILATIHIHFFQQLISFLLKLIKALSKNFTIKSANPTRVQNQDSQSGSFLPRLQFGSSHPQST